MVVLFGITWSISDSFVLIAYTLILCAFLIRSKADLKDFGYTEVLPSLLTMWRLFVAVIKGTFGLKAIWKGFKFLFDVSPVYVFRKEDLLNRSRHLFVSFLLSVSLVTVLAFAVRLFNLPVDMYDHGTQMKAFFMNHIKSGFVWSLASLVCLILGFKWDRRILLLFPLLIGGLMITEARSYYLGFILSSLGVFLLIGIKRSPRYMLYGGGVILATFVAGYLIEPVRVRFLSIFTGLETDNSIKCRLIMWKEGLLSVQDNLLLGIGFQGWPTFFGSKGYPCPNYHAHNILIHELVETGIVGFTILVAFLVYIFYRLVRAYLRSRGWIYEEAVILTGFAALVNFVVGGMFEPALVKTVVLVPTFTVVGLALGVADRRGW